VTENLYGENSPEYASVQEAWKAVGLNDSYDPTETQDGLDLSMQVLGVQSSEIQTCIVDEFYPIEITVTNTGTVEYTPAMNGVITISASGLDQIDFVLENPIAVGESMDILIDDYVYFGSAFETNISTYLALNDDINFNNDFAGVYVSNSTQTAFDAIFYMFPSDESCSLQEIYFQYWILNESCASLPAQSDASISLYDDKGTLLGEESFKTDTEIGSGDLLTGIFILGTENIGDAVNYTARLELENDTNSENNVSLGFIAEPNQPSQMQFLNTFTDESDLNNNISRITTSNFDPIVTYEGENYLSTSGDPFAFENYCSDPFILFDIDGTDNQVTTRLDLCLDLSNISGAALKFDLVQFRDNVPFYPELITSICKLTIQSDQNGTYEDYLYDLEEGVIQNFLYPLADDFVGGISFQFFNRSGREILADFFKGDVILLDNLEITSIVDSEDIPDKNVSARIFPNPTSDILNLRLKKAADSYSIVNAQGQVIKRGILTELDAQIDLLAISSGYYILNLHYTDQDQETIPFVHIK